MNDGRTISAAKNFKFNMLNKIVTIILSFISRTIFIWGFGVSFLGINGLFNDILNLLSMTDLGFSTAISFSFYKLLANNDYNQIAALTNFYKKIYQKIALAVLIIGIAIIPALPYLIKLDKNIPLLNVYYLFSLSNVVFSYLFIYKTSILTADQKNYVVVKITIISNIIKTILQITSIFFFKNYIIYLIIGTATTLFNNIYASKVASQYYPFINRNIQLDSKHKTSIFKNIYSAFIYKVSSVLLTATDNILISVIAGTISVGLYSNYLLIQTTSITFFTLIFSSLTASIGNLIATEGYKKRLSIFKITQSIGFVLGCIIVPCYITLINDFIRIWLGSKFLYGNNVVLVIGLNMYLATVLQPLWLYRDATGLYNKTKWIMLICAIENIFLSIVLGKIFGIFGIIFASSISRISTYIWYEPLFLYKEYFNENPSSYFYALIKNFILIVLITIICSIISSTIIVNNFALWFVKALLFLIITTLVAVISYHNSEGIQLLKQKMYQLKK